MSRFLAAALAVAALSAGSVAARNADFAADPLAAVDLHRAAIVADIVKSFDADFSAYAPAERALEEGTLARRLNALRADRLLAASLASSRAVLDEILADAEKAREPVTVRTTTKSFGDSNKDLLYTPITPCRLVDTRGFGAPIQGGAFTPEQRRGYAPAGLCGLPTSRVAGMLVSFTTQNLTPNSGGYLAMLAPGAPVTTSVDVFNFGSAWSASNTFVATGPAAEFDVLVSSANAHVVIDILGYFMAPAAGSVGTNLLADQSVTAAKLASNGCAAGQNLKYNGTTWVCSTPQLVSFNGSIGNISGPNPLNVFAGPPVTIIVTGNTTKLVGSGSLVLGTAAGTLYVNIDLCYKGPSQSTPIFFMTPLTVQATPNRTAFAVAGMKGGGLAPGTYQVGVCVQNGNSAALTNNDWSSGFVWIID